MAVARRLGVLLIAGAGAYAYWRQTEQKTAEAAQVAFVEERAAMAAPSGAETTMRLFSGLLNAFGQGGGRQTSTGGLPGVVGSVFGSSLGARAIPAGGSDPWEGVRALIRRYESANNYDAIVYLVDRSNYPPRRLTQMTIGEVLDWQRSIDPLQNSEAVGAYQIMEDTLRAYYRRAGLDRDDMFSRSNQDRIADVLIEQKRGMGPWLTGRMSLEEAMTRLAREWAAFPVPNAMQGHRMPVVRGESFYKAVAGNRAHVSPEDVERALLQARGVYA